MAQEQWQRDLLDFALENAGGKLSRGRQVVLRGRGHGNDLIGDGAEDGRAAVDRFLASGHAPRAVCVWALGWTLGG